MMKKICALGLAFGMMISAAAPLCAMATPAVTAAPAATASTDAAGTTGRQGMFGLMGMMRNLITNYPYVVACMAIGAGIGYIIQLNLPVKAKIANAAAPAITVKTAQK